MNSREKKLLGLVIVARPDLGGRQLLLFVA